jgi:stearoyl-CoA desaturase (Delta-9 desaturase)
VIERAAQQLAATFNADRIAAVITAALASANLAALQEQLSATQRRAADVLGNLHLPHLPTRQEILAQATAMYASTPSIEDIVDRAHALILDAVGARLCPVPVAAR